MDMSPECRAKLLAQLKEAEAAYHQLMIGGGVREIRDQNGESVSFSQSNRQALYAYILQLRNQLGMDGCGTPVAPTRPLTFIY